MKALVWALRGALLIVLVTPLALVGAAPPASLQVLRLLPAPGSTEVPLNGLVTAIFDRPVVPLARLGAGPAAATITPPMAGQQRWLGTTMWAIVPAHGLAPATTYTLRLNPEVRAVDGTTLAAPATPWQFTTLRPAVAGVLPANGATGRLPHTPIELLFNLPVVRASAQAHFSLRLRPGGAALPGAFSWPNARTMRFTPSVPLPRGAFPRIHESTGVLALGGPLPGYRAFSSSFGVAPAFALSSTTPQDGATAVEPYLSVYVQFTAPVDLRAAPRYVSVRPQLAAQYIGVSDQDTLTINGDFRPSTTYRVTVKAGFPDLLGDRLPATRTISFQTAPYQASLQLIDVGSLNTYDAYRPVHLYANVTNVSSVTLNLYRQSKDEFLQTIAPDFNRSTFSPDGLPLVASFTQQVHAPLNKTVAIQVSPGSAQGRLLPP
ncbi:MAG TPA: Ig-like domain-containing protein, partial [Chloroflexota bacterium]|nr:Ig-like domain-containing protein [Chloroflexota bacterium]